jgi:GTP-binding protein
VRIESARFEVSAFRPEDEPRERFPEVVFLGRSNVGKSSMINRLLGTKGLARTSSTPGRTQSVNFYRVNDRFWFVDLPGYGYAKVPEAVRRAWRPMIEGYLERHADRIAVAVVVADARHEPTDLDRLMRDWLHDRGIRHLVAATKADKLSGNARSRAQAELGRGFPDSPLSPAPLLVSAETGRGIRELWKVLDAALDAAREGRDGVSRLG